MKIIIWLLLLFALAVAMALASHNPGYLQLVYPPYRIEMSLPLFLLALLALFVLSYFVLHFVFTVVRLPATVRRIRAERIQAKGRTATMEALSAFLEGRYAEAEKAAKKAMGLGDRSAIFPIIAARAAHELREFDKRDAYLEAAESKSVGETTMRLMAATKFRLDQRQPEAALESLRKLREAGVKNHVGALQLELKAHQQARNWDAVLDTINWLEKRDAVDTTVATQLRQQAWLEKIVAQVSDEQALKNVWRVVPDEIKRRSKVATAAAHAFIELGDCESAQQILTDSLDDRWDSDLALLYGDCHGAEVVQQIDRAERWLVQHPGDAKLLLTLGKLCLSQGLWGKAQNYLDASISVNPTRAAYTALGQLAEKLQKPDEAFKHFQRAMELARTEE